MKKVSHIIVDVLAREGVRVIFGIPGVQNLEIFDALSEREAILTVIPRHEQGAGYMADGYARASGKPGVIITVPGPGVLNTITPVAEAYAESSPLLLITTEVPFKEIPKRRGYLHEMEDQMGIFRGVVKSAYRVESPEKTGEIILKAYRESLAGRPAPVYVEIPLDFLIEEIPEKQFFFEKEFSFGNFEEVDEALIEKCLKLIKSAKRPLIYAGYGTVVSSCRKEILELSEKIQAGVITSVKAKGIVPWDHPLHIGTAWCKEVKESKFIKEADLVLAIGTSLSARTWAHGKLEFSGKLVHIDIDPRKIGRNYETELGITGSAKRVLRKLLDALGDFKRKEDEVFLREISEFKKNLQERVKNTYPQLYQIFKVLEEELKGGNILVSDLAMAGIWAARYLPVYHPRTFIFPMEFGSIGFGFPESIGAKIAHPQKKVICLTGDGGFLFNVQELATCKMLDLDITILLFNDGRYGSVRCNQLKRFGRVFGVDLFNPDFVKLVESFSGEGVKLKKIEDFERMYSNLCEKRGIKLIEIDSTFLTSY